jgi:hypothetical protein
VNRSISVSALVVIMILVFAGFVFGAVDAKKEKPQKDKTVIAKKSELTNQELALHIKDMLNAHEDVTSYIKGLKKESAEDGSSYYTYNGVKLEALDKQALKSILGRVQSEVTRINTDRISKQIETIQQTQRTVAATQQAARASGSVATRLPVIVTNPPAPPRIPAAPPPAPRNPPSPPPAPPRR